MIAASRVDEQFRAYVASDEFSCLAGRGVVNSGAHTLAVYGLLGSARSTRRLASDLGVFAKDLDDSNAHLRAFIAVFPTQPPADEATFEQRLWKQLQALSDIESPDVPWSGAVSDDPADPQFSFSFAGQAFFIVGLHAASSRVSRRFRWPTLVFNPRMQFDDLRANGRFDRLRGMIREREIAIQGSLNPNLADFGEASEARQYSGRAVEPGWECPFHHKSP